MESKWSILALAMVCAVGLWQPPAANAEEALPVYLHDRGAGIHTSMFGTYIGKGEWVVYPFFELYRDDNMEYSPNDFGYGLDQDFRGKFRASEGLLFVGYGLSAPAGTPKPILARLKGTITAMMTDKAILERLHGIGYETDLQIGDAYKDFIVKDPEQWRSVARAANIKTDK
jgi:hypothetical protein